MDSSDAIAGPGAVPFTFLAPTNQAEASGSVSHCGENGISNTSEYWSDATCSADCGGSFYGSNLVDNCSVCDADTSNDCTQDCNDAWGGPDNIKDNGDEAYEDHCGTCDADTSNDCVVLTLSSNSTGSATVSYVSSYDIGGFQMNVTGPTLTSASTDMQQVDMTASSGLVVGYSIGGDILPATCTLGGYGELCPLDSAAEMVSVGFSEIYNGYDFNIANVVVAANDAMGTALPFSSPDSALAIAACDDVDGDTVCDAVDQCDGNDADPDTDGDGVCEDIDACLGDDASGDSDNDSICDNLDACAGYNDLLDNDNDGTPDDCDACDNDPNKIAEGVCGCDVADTDCAFLTLGDVVQLPESCVDVCQSQGTDNWAGSCHPVFDPTGVWVQECTSGLLGLEVNYYAGQDVTGYQFNLSLIHI